jgi:hypothetical protein
MATGSEPERWSALAPSGIDLSCALEVFKDDSAASGKIMAAAI